MVIVFIIHPQIINLQYQEGKKIPDNGSFHFGWFECEELQCRSFTLYFFYDILSQSICYCCFNFLHWSPCSAIFLNVSLLCIIFSILCSFFLQFAELSSSILNFHLAYSKPHYELVKTNLNSQARFEVLCSVYPWENKAGITQVRRERKGMSGRLFRLCHQPPATSVLTSWGPEDKQTSFWSRAQHLQAMWHWVTHITTSEPSDVYATYRLYALLILWWCIF